MVAVFQTAHIVHRMPTVDALIGISQVNERAKVKGIASAFESYQWRGESWVQKLPVTALHVG